MAEARRSRCGGGAGSARPGCVRPRAIRSGAGLARFDMALAYVVGAGGVVRCSRRWLVCRRAGERRRTAAAAPHTAQFNGQPRQIAQLATKNAAKPPPHRRTAHNPTSSLSRLRSWRRKTPPGRQVTGIQAPAIGRTRAARPSPETQMESRRRREPLSPPPAHRHLPDRRPAVTPPPPCTLSAGSRRWKVGAWSSFRERHLCPALRAPGGDLRPERKTMADVQWEVALRAPVQGR
jgi:hypothetical protein